MCQPRLLQDINGLCNICNLNNNIYLPNRTHHCFRKGPRPSWTQPKIYNLCCVSLFVLPLCYHTASLPMDPSSKT